jgi:hypothetical protein
MRRSQAKSLVRRTHETFKIYHRPTRAGQQDTLLKRSRRTVQSASRSRASRVLPGSPGGGKANEIMFKDTGYSRSVSEFVR